MTASMRVGVLLSGSGTNLQAILDGAGPEYEVVVAVSDRADAYGLERARSAGVEAVHLDPKAHESRESLNEALADVLREHRVELVCLAGFMRILAPNFIKAFEGRILNIHPALLPAFPGAHAVREALEWGVQVTGCTVHFADEEVDHGPILLQEAVPILPGDDEGRLHERIKTVEHRLYPEAIRLIALGHVRIDGRRVVLGPEE
ncbi:MAG TPA: phosphoribosylglycinamide formyltransferase [Actinomycetota bacterium]|nr:phosphoribosylglycinamide formyltransferase [Actinomycetota bacterium]